jgi:hypothetical protein
VTYFNVNGCNFEGELPPEFSGWNAIAEFIIYNNKFT